MPLTPWVGFRWTEELALNAHTTLEHHRSHPVRDFPVGIFFFFIHSLTPFYGSFTLVPARLSWFLLQQCKSLSPPASATKGGNRTSTCRQVKGLEVLLCSLYS